VQHRFRSISENRFEKRREEFRGGRTPLILPMVWMEGTKKRGVRDTGNREDLLKRKRKKKDCPAGLGSLAKGPIFSGGGRRRGEKKCFAARDGEGRHGWCVGGKEIAEGAEN